MYVPSGNWPQCLKNFWIITMPLKLCEFEEELRTSFPTATTFWKLVEEAPSRLALRLFSFTSTPALSYI